MDMEIKEGRVCFMGLPMLTAELLELADIAAQNLRDALSSDQERFIKFLRLYASDRDCANPGDTRIWRSFQFAPDLFANHHKPVLVPKPPTRRSKAGFIYLCRDNRNDLVKIGFSTVPAFREKTLQSEVPEITMLFHFPGTMALEKELHRRYVAHRVRGEWFSLTEDEVAKIKSDHTPA